jgi:Na+/proline symporter
VIIAAPAVVLSIVLGWHEATTILAIGLSTTAYTMFGGVQAVTWTDVKQMIVVFVGISVCFVVIATQLPSELSWRGALSIAGATGRLRTVDTSFNLKETYTLWSGLIGGLFLMLSYFGCDQSQVQRFLTAKSVGEGRTSLLMSAFVKIPMQVLILLVGVMVFVFYQFQKPPLIFNRVETARAQASQYSADYQALDAEYDKAFSLRREAALNLVNHPVDSPNERSQYQAANERFNDVRKRAIELIRKVNNGAAFTDINYVFPTFVTTHAPAGVVGLIIAAIFAAAMSAVSAELNALSTATVIDFYRRHFRPGASDSHYLKVSKLATGFWGLFACFVALYAGRLGSLIEVVNRFGSYFYGSLLGVFVLALGVRRATGRGAFWGLIAGILTVATVSRLSDISFLWYNLVGCVAVVVVGYLISLTDSRPMPATGPQIESVAVESQ